MNIFSEYLLLPSGVIAVFAALALIAWLIPRYRRLAMVPLSVAMLTYLVLGSGITSFWIMSHLEYEYAPGQETLTGEIPDTMVVLTGYAKADAQIPLSAHVNTASGFRVLEAARIFNRARRLTVVISGNDDVPLIMRDLLIGMGVPEKFITTDAISYNTYESAVHLRDRLKGKRFYLVTSAGHMPRAMGVFRKQGLDPVPAPTNYLSTPSTRDWNLLPNGQHLAISDLAVHEVLGLVWYRLLGRL